MRSWLGRSDDLADLPAECRAWVVECRDGTSPPRTQPLPLWLSESGPCALRAAPSCKSLSLSSKSPAVGRWIIRLSPCCSGRVFSRRRSCSLSAGSSATCDRTRAALAAAGVALLALGGCAASSSDQGIAAASVEASPSPSSTVIPGCLEFVQAVKIWADSLQAIQNGTVAVQDAPGIMAEIAAGLTSAADVASGRLKVVAQAGAVHAGRIRVVFLQGNLADFASSANGDALRADFTEGATLCIGHVA